MSGAVMVEKVSIPVPVRAAWVGDGAGTGAIACGDGGVGGGGTSAGSEPGPGQVAGRIFRPGGQGAPFAGSVLLLHGYGGTGGEVAGLALHLAEEGFSVLCPDLPGHGETGGLLDYEPALDACVACCHWLVARQAGEPGVGGAGLALVGFSLGARLALACARLFEKSGGGGLEGSPVKVAGVVMISPPGRPILSIGGGDKTDALEEKLAMAMVRRRQGVREKGPFHGLNRILEELGPDLGPVDREENRLILYAGDDLASVKEAAAGFQVSREVTGTSHLDIITSPRVLALVPRWLAEGLGFSASGPDRGTGAGSGSMGGCNG